MTWLYFAASSVAFFTILDLIQRKIAVNSKYALAASVVFNIWGGLAAVIIFFLLGTYKNLVITKDPLAWLFMLFAFAMYGMYERGRFSAAKLLDASTLAIVSNFSLIVAFIGSIFLYHEHFSTSKIAGAALITISLLFISLGHKATHKITVKGLVVGLTIYTFLGLGWMLDKRGSILFSPGVYNLLGWTLPFLVIFPGVKKAEVIHEAKTGSWKIALIAVLNVIGYYLQLTAQSIGEATKVIPIVQTSTLFIVIFGILLLGEKENLWRKITAGVIGLVGAWLLIGA